MNSFFASLFHQQRLVTILSLAVVVALSASIMQWSGDRLMMIDLSSGAALYAANRVDGIVEGVKLAREIIASGGARAKVDEFVQYTRKFS